MKLLYLHNRKDWAVHNVGKLWFGEVDSADVRFTNFKELEPNFGFDQYDYVIWGFTFIYYRFLYDAARSIVVIHDPIELFEELEKDPTISEWEDVKMDPERVRMLNSCKRIITASEQIQRVLKNNGIEASVIPTMSSLSCIDEKEIKHAPPRIISVYNKYPRKNVPLMLEIYNDLKSSIPGISFLLKMGSEVLSEEDYMKLLDRHNIYLCTSFLEGGPIPAMDAMHRGGVVLTTAVGQMREIVRDGENGFFCHRKEDFIKRIHQLLENPELLYSVRQASLNTIKRVRNKRVIARRVEELLNGL